MEIAVVSDSHVPERAEAIPAEFRERVEAADLVVHAGDFTSPEALSDFRDLATELVAVHGNMDPRNLDLPAVATHSAEGVTLVLTHGTGSPADYVERVAGVAAEAAEGVEEGVVAIAGHTHEVLDTAVEGVRLLNPGSVTGAAPADRATMVTLEVADGETEVWLHDLGP